ncbi:hypothetical protein HIM_08016 [Hirsutella minnesotensis 3608]|uniref:Metallo-beta-lactamase domain-containing protein n=1 Tax=Hirsutella minnesotensis 3608 TaxID=1043627 RepID=A0A0F7ZYL0_9HYPO|nr:hypothetical protein HIM_08016 [Hirsutella minnesotensis 3608]
MRGLLSQTARVAGDPPKDGKRPAVRVVATPGKHVPPGPLSVTNDILKAISPTNGWILELGFTAGSSDGAKEQGSGWQVGYRIYISGDTLVVDELREIPKRLQGEKIGLTLVHLGGTTIPGPSAPLVMVTVDAHQGLELMQLMDPDVTIPIHFDDYNVFLSPLSDFRDKVDKAGYQKRVVCLDRENPVGLPCGMIFEQSPAPIPTHGL